MQVTLAVQIFLQHSVCSVILFLSKFTRKQATRGCNIKLVKYIMFRLFDRDVADSKTSFLLVKNCFDKFKINFSKQPQKLFFKKTGPLYLQRKATSQFLRESSLSNLIKNIFLIL